MSLGNEIILIISLILEFLAVAILFKILKKQGLYLWTVLVTILANIEVLILVKAFGMEMTLGNILFASSFLVTDILSELYGKEASEKAVSLGIATSICTTFITASWLLYIPSKNDMAYIHIRHIFSSTPRIMIASIVVYIIVQYFDVWLYHKLWSITEKIFNDKRKYLWLRNNVSTLTSQLLNTVLYTFFAFYGVYNTKTLLSIIISSYIIFVVTSICDTPFIYLCRMIYERENV